MPQECQQDVRARVHSLVMGTHCPAVGPYVTVFSEDRKEAWSLEKLQLLPLRSEMETAAPQFHRELSRLILRLQARRFRSWIFYVPQGPCVKG